MNELSRPLAAERIGAAGLAVMVKATEEECAAIARRLSVPAVAWVRCEWQVRLGHGGGLEAEGSLQARLSQTCVVTLDDFDSEIIENFAVRFVPSGMEDEAADDPDEPDEIPFDGGTLDLGEATVEQLALALDPYPRKPGAALDALNASPEDGQWAALAKWRRPH